MAVYSREQAQADAFAAKHGAQAAYTSLETLLADARVEVVCIASPNFLHAPYTVHGGPGGETCVRGKAHGAQCPTKP